MLEFLLCFKLPLGSNMVILDFYLNLAVLLLCLMPYPGFNVRDHASIRLVCSSVAKILLAFSPPRSTDSF